MPYNPSQMMNFVPVPVSVPFPSAVVGYNQRRRDDRTRDYSRVMKRSAHPRDTRRRSDQQTRNYRADYLRRDISSGSGKERERRSYGSRGNSNRRERQPGSRRDYGRGGGGDRRQRRSGGGDGRRFKQVVCVVSVGCCFAHHCPHPIADDS